MNTDIGIAQQAAAMASPQFLKPVSGDAGSGGVTEGQKKKAAAASGSNKDASGSVELKKTEEPADKKDVKPVGIERFMNRGIRLELNQETGIVVAKLVDKETGEVIRQVPPEELMKVAEAIKEELGHNNGGLLVNREA